MLPELNTATHSYWVYGLSLASNMLLPELRSAAGTHDLQVQFATWSEPSPTPTDWFMSWSLPSGQLWLACAKIDAGYLLRFAELADFHVDAYGQDIVCRVWPQTPAETLRHLLLDQVLPLVLNLRGQHALHATAILTPAGVCAFAGQTGAGKSTLAASFLHAGFPVVSDDCLVLQNQQGEQGEQDQQDSQDQPNQIYAVPAYPGVRLWDDSLEAVHGPADQFPFVAHYAAKRRVMLAQRSSDFPLKAQPLAAIYVLLWPEEEEEIEKEHSLPKLSRLPRIEPLSCREAYTQLLPQLFRLDITDREMLKRQFDWLGRVVEQVPVRRLVVPDDLAALDRVRAAVLADLDLCT